MPNINVLCGGLFPPLYLYALRFGNTNKVLVLRIIMRVRVKAFTGPPSALLAARVTQSHFLFPVNVESLVCSLLDDLSIKVSH